MKTIAMICMLIDHIGLVFFPQQILWRLIGRLAMPIFAFGVARGAYYTSSMRRYMKKMLVFSLVSQLPFWWVETLAVGATFPSLHFNIGFTFLWALIILCVVQKSHREQRSLRLVEILMVMFLLVSAETLGFDYGSYGIILVLMYYLMIVRGQGVEKIGLMILSYTALTYLCFMNDMDSFLLQEVGVLGIVIVGLLKNISEKKIGWLFYIFYPVHLLILGIIKWGIR